MASPEQIPLTVSEVRRLWHAQHEPEWQRALRLRWSHFRRTHQAVAKRCHMVRRSYQQPLPRQPVQSPIMVTGLAELTDDQWKQIQLILPPQRPPTGRPAVDHRQIVEGILWIIRTGSSWRELPKRFGPWSTVASRYRRWRLEGLWTRILQILQAPSDALVSTG
jgi:transposase